MSLSLVGDTSLAGLAKLVELKADCEGLAPTADESAEAKYNIARRHVDIWISDKQREIDMKGASFFAGQFNLTETDIPSGVTNAANNFKRAATGGRESSVDALGLIVDPATAAAVDVIVDILKKRRAAKAELLKSRLNALRWVSWDEARNGEPQFEEDEDDFITDEDEG